MAFYECSDIYEEWKRVLDDGVSPFPAFFVIHPGVQSVAKSFRAKDHGPIKAS
jgi:hypothetical protein